MLTIRKVGQAYHADLMQPGRQRLRGSLGTHNSDAARRLAHRIETALSEGSNSDLWPDLKATLPHDTFVRFADVVGFKPKVNPHWADLEINFRAHLSRRVQTGDLSATTRKRYLRTLDDFSDFVAQHPIKNLTDIGRAYIEEFKAWRHAKATKHKRYRGGGSIALDVAILHRAFQHAIECETLVKNPVILDGPPGSHPQNGAEPFNPQELAKLRVHANDDLPAVLVLRWTGLRRSDVVALEWTNVDLRAAEITCVPRKTRKMGTRVVIPMHKELHALLLTTYKARKPGPIDKVLLHPATGKPFSCDSLYTRIRALGKRAGVQLCKPHRFRDTLAVDMLCRGASPYDVAKILGDTIRTIEKHYVPFVKELQGRVRNILNNDRAGLESLAALPEHTGA